MPLSVNGLSLRSLADRAARRARLFVRGESPRSFFDVRDPGLVNPLFVAAGLPAPAVVPASNEPGEKVYELRHDIRQLMPLALAPLQRGAFLQWFLDHGRHEFDTTPDELLAYLLALDATPDRGLVPCYLAQPWWQELHPHALSPDGWRLFKNWLADEFDITGRWLRRARLPEKYSTPRPSGGVNVVGLFRYNSGLQRVATELADALRTAGLPTELRDVPMPANRDGRPRAGFDGLEPFDISILNTGLDLSVTEVYRLAALHPRRDVYRVAVWWWELEQLPAEWLARGRDVQEIWAPTRFIADAMRPLGRPVFPMLPSVRLPAFEPRPKTHFGLDPAKFTFLFVFDMNSRMPRKNPLGLIRAFRLAFDPSDPVELVIKVGEPDDRHVGSWRELRAGAAAGGVTLIDRHLSRGDLLALMNAADAYVSLHRSEGLGLTMAESMMLGKPTIGTAYSGNLDFMTPENSYLVRYDRGVIADDVWPYPKGCAWAEPSVEHAAELMRHVFKNRGEAVAVAARGKDEVTRLLSPEVAGRRMAARLASIRAARPT